MIKEIQLSVYGTAIRTENWLKLYKNIVCNNNINIEIVLCGNIKPKFTLPKNFKFIYSNVKPSQCSAIALKNTRSNLVSLIGDDCVYSENYFDYLYEFHKNNDDFIVGGKFMRNKKLYRTEDYMLSKEIPNSPVFSMSPILKKDEIFAVGGIDQNFIAVMWHEDVIMRLITQKKRNTKIHEKSICEELTASDYNILKRIYKNIKKKYSRNYISDGPNLFQKYGMKYDLPYLYSCWIDRIENASDSEILSKNKFLYISKKRLKKVVPFELEDLLNKTQGPRGKW